MDHITPLRNPALGGGTSLPPPPPHHTVALHGHSGRKEVSGEGIGKGGTGQGLNEILWLNNFNFDLELKPVAFRMNGSSILFGKAHAADPASAANPKAQRAGKPDEQVTADPNTNQIKITEIKEIHFHS